jgi:pantoate--beta-alanine ligase
MDVITGAAEIQRQALERKRRGTVIGFVPTMGFLHEGHLSLMRMARERCDWLVVSIFVNPAQFGPNEDLAAYPRDFECDEALCRAVGVDALFYPTAADMYADDASVWVNEESLSSSLCGASRPGHFRGVCTVVAMLFNLVLPDLAVFGEKDAQQLRIIERMVRDLHFPVEIVRGPIVREADGLAMSSRNKYLSETERRDALCLQRSLVLAAELVRQGERSAAVICRQMRALIEQVRSAAIDYIQIVDDESLVDVEVLTKDVLIALAVKVGSTRLIDNCILPVGS